MSHRSSFAVLLPWLAVLVVGSVFVAPSAAEQLPFSSQSAVPLPHGRLTLDFGVGYRSQARDFGLAVRDRQWDFGATRLTFGLGDWVEVQASGIVHSSHQTSLPGVGSRSDSDFGDWRLGTKVRLLGEKGHRPAVSFLWEVKLPNASNRRGVGTDETDFLALFLVSKSVGDRDRFDLNAGMALLGIPDRQSRQDDVTILRLSWRHGLGRRWDGSADPRGPWAGVEWTLADGFVPGDSPVVGRGLVGRDFERWSLYGGVSVGLNQQADDWSATVGFRRRFDFGTR